MTVQVRLFATLRLGRFKKKEMTFEAPTPRSILKELEIDLEDVAILLVNGRDGDFDQDLISGDTLSVFPPVGGG